MTDDNVVHLYPDLVPDLDEDGDGFSDSAEMVVYDPPLPASILDSTIVPRRDVTKEVLDRCRGALEYRWYAIRFHTVRSPAYAFRYTTHAGAGAWKVTSRVWHWTHDTEGLILRTQASLDPNLTSDAKTNTFIKADDTRWNKIKWRRPLVGLAVLFLLLVIRWGIHAHPWWSLLTGLATAVCLGMVGATRSEVIPYIEDPTPQVISIDAVIRAFFKAKIAKDALEPATVIGVPHKDGPGTVVKVEVPDGITFADVLSNRDRLASALHCPKQCLELDDLPDEAEALLELFIADQPPSKIPPPAWPLLMVDRWDVFRPLPVGVTPKGKPVCLSLLWVHTLIGAAPRRGKALDVDTPMLTTAGWTTMGSLKSGDEIFHPDGHPTKIVEAFEVMHDHRCYRVTTTDGRSIIADGGHLWTVADRRRRSNHKPAPWETITTEEMLDAGLTADKGKAFAFRLPQQHVLITKPVDLPFDPYLFGAWLGDGSSSSAKIFAGDEDVAEMSDLIKQSGTRIVSTNKHGGCWHITFNIDTPMRDGFEARIRRMGIWKNKHIPDMFLTAGTEQRIALLQGLMDTDGSAPVDKRGRTIKVEFSSKWRPLAEGVLYLCRSLGMRATLNDHAAYLNGAESGRRYRVTWTPQDGDINPFRLRRKAAIIDSAEGRPQRRSISCIKSIEPVASRPVRCIKVEREDGLFLAGRDLMPTHNTTLLRMIAIAALLDPRARLIVVDFGGGLDYTPFKPYCLRWIHGPEAEQIQEFYDLLLWLGEEYKRRQLALSKLPVHKAPEARLTPALAELPEFAPIQVVVDEFQVATMAKKIGEVSKMGELIVETWAELEKVSPKVGITIVKATQTADDSVPTELRNISLQRVALSMASYQASMAVLGNTAQKLGYDASTLGGLPGLAYSWGTDSGEVDGYRGKVRFSNVTPADAAQLLERIGRLRTKVSVQVEDIPKPGRPQTPQIVTDVLRVWPAGEVVAHLHDLAEALGRTRAEVSGPLRKLGLAPNQNLKIRGVNRSGYDLIDIQNLAPNDPP